MTISKRIFECAEEHGFYDDYRRVMERLTDEADKKFVRSIWLNHRLMLIVSELAEGLEAVRDGNFDTMPKSGGLGEELADARIRIEDLFQHVYEIGTDAAVLTKVEHNESRPHKHGRGL